MEKKELEKLQVSIDKGKEELGKLAKARDDAQAKFYEQQVKVDKLTSQLPQADKGAPIREYLAFQKVQAAERLEERQRRAEADAEKDAVYKAHLESKSKKDGK
jgi:hypothetical protein